jgi:hypothetical protein
LIDGGALTISPHNPDIIWTCGSGSINGAYRIQTSWTIDGGTTWIHDTIPDSIARANALAFDPFDSSRILIGGDSIYNYKLLLLSTDLGNTWQHTGNGLSGIVYALAPSPLTNGLIYAGTNQGLFKSTDGGDNWQRSGSFTMVRSIAIDQTNDSLIYAGTNTGVYLTTDAGTSWQPVNEGLANTDILCLAFRSAAPRTVFAGTNGASIFITTPPTGIKQPGSYRTLSELDLSAEPNPCPGILTITVFNQKSGMLTGGIYDRTGRLVLGLAPRMVAPGPASWQVDLRRLPTGIYFLRIKTKAKGISRSLVRVN